MIIDRITIRDFQSIAHAEIELGPWTSLVGESDVGKSAIVRALYAALTNQRGDLFIRRGASQCVVRLDLDGGQVVEWQKTRGRSGEYTIIDAEGGYQTFEKTGGEVPPEVATLLRVAVPVAGEALLPGLQRQHDPPFLFADTPRRRAQILGEFDGTNILLHADGELRKQLRGEQGKATAAREAAQVADAALLEVEWVDGAAELVAGAQRAHSAHDTASQALGILEGVGKRIGMVAGVLGVATATLGLTPPAPVIDFDEIDRLTAALAAMIRLRTSIGPITSKRDAWVRHPVPSTFGVAEDLDHLDVMQAAANRVREAQGQVTTAVNGLAQTAVAESKAADALRLLVGTACPECGQPLTADGLGVA